MRGRWADQPRSDRTGVDRCRWTRGAFADPRPGRDDYRRPNLYPAQTRFDRTQIAPVAVVIFLREGATPRAEVQDTQEPISGQPAQPGEIETARSLVGG